MASCNTQCGCNSCTRVGALNSICRSGSFPFYTGPCPAAPCTTTCGTCAANTTCTGCTNARVTCSDCGCNPCHCTSCCDSCNSCGCSDSCSPCECSSCSCDPCHSCECSVCCDPYTPCCDSCNSCECTPCCDSCECSHCSSCECSHCCDGCSYGYGNYASWNGCNHRSCHIGHAVFSARGAINLSAGGAVPLSARHADANYFTTSYGNVLIRRPGLYYAAITLDVPGNCDADTVIRLELDNQAISPPEISVCGSGNYAGHTVFHARAGSLLKLSSLEALCLPDTGAHAFTLTLFRLG